jgi:hypothetical protein
MQSVFLYADQWGKGRASMLVNINGDLHAITHALRLISFAGLRRFGEDF